MDNTRTKWLIGEAGTARLAASRVMIFGAGGVGSYAIEALTRVGVGALDVVDFDKVSESNLNRQLIALSSTVGMAKTAAAKLRAADINPQCRFTAHELFVTPENLAALPIADCAYVIDAIDNVSAKLALAVFCSENKIPLISSMGTGNKLHGERFKICDIYETSVCPLARVMRHELKKRGVKALKVLFSDEAPLRQERPPGSVSFVPSVAGLLIAGEVVRDLLV